MFIFTSSLRGNFRGKRQKNKECKYFAQAHSEGCICCLECLVELAVLMSSLSWTILTRLLHPLVIHVQGEEVREAELLTRRRLEWEEGELLHGTCCTPCDLGLVGGHLCTQQLQSQQGREILALRRGKKTGINVRRPCSEASGGAVIV